MRTRHELRLSGEIRPASPLGDGWRGNRLADGETHRLAARVDSRYQLVAGCLSIDRTIADGSARICLLPDERSYYDFEAMARAEAARPDGIEVVTICTPPHLHAAASTVFLQAGIDVLCEKPRTRD